MDRRRLVTAALVVSCGLGVLAGCEARQPLAVRVVTGREAAARLPAAGATVAVDSADGARVEKQAGADGVARFEVNLEAGPATVTAFLAGHPLRTRTGVASGTAEVVLALDALATTWPRATVTLWGTAVGMTSLDHGLAVSPSLPTTYSFTSGPQWMFQVPPGVPFSLVAFESGPGTEAVSPRGHSTVLGPWAVLDHPAVTEETEVSLALGAAVQVRRAQGSIALPTRPSSLLRSDARPNGWVGSRESQDESWLGNTTYADVAADQSRVDYRLEWVEPAFVREPVTTLNLYLVRGDFVDRSWVRIPGYPDGGVPPSGFLDFPTLVTPEDGLVPSGLDASVAWTLHDQDVDVRLHLTRPGPGGFPESSWLVEVPRGATSLRLPALPGGVDAGEVLGSELLAAALEAYRVDATGDWEQAVAATTVVLRSPAPLATRMLAVPRDRSVFDPAPPLGLYVYLPPDYQGAPARQWPTLFFIPGSHGVGNGTTDLHLLLEEGLPYVIEAGAFPAADAFIVVAVQCPGVCEPDQLDAVVDFAASKWRLDPARLYLTGASGGAFGTWGYQNARGDAGRFAALVPISGNAGASLGAQFRHVGVWAFHGQLDANLPWTPWEATAGNIGRINAAGPDVPARCTIYRFTGHDERTTNRTYDLTGMRYNPTDPAYAPFDRNLYDWLLQFHR